MTRKDFELIAQWLHNSRPVNYENGFPSSTAFVEYAIALKQWEATVETFADGLKRNNVRFDKDKFKAACENGFA